MKDTIESIRKLFIEKFKIECLNLLGRDADYVVEEATIVGRITALADVIRYMEKK